MLSLIALAVAAFAATNIDNLFVLLAFIAEARGHKGQVQRVMVGQYAGSFALIAIALGLAAMLRSLPPGYVGALGVLPIAVGLSKAWTRFGPRGAERDHAQSAASEVVQAGSSWLTVAGVAIANGSDNIAVYVPLYAGRSHSECALISFVFAVMIGIWCAGAVWLVNHPLLGAPIRRYGTALLPVILLVIGVSVIVQNDTLHVLFGW